MMQRRGASPVARAPSVASGRSLNRAATAIVVAAALLSVAFLFANDMATSRRLAADSWTYLAAGERLNAGHELYALTEGDRPVLIRPPYWTVPLLSPPFIAVVWRPLALLGDMSMLLWWELTALSILIVMGTVLLRIPAIAGAAILVLSPAIRFELGVANVNGLLLGGIVFSWWLALRRQDGPAGALIAVMGALKLAPAVLILWFIAQRRWTAVRWFLVAGVACLVLSIVGAGLDSHVDYLLVAQETQLSGLSDMSIAGLLLGLGAPPTLAPIVTVGLLIFGAIEVFALRHRPRLAFVVAVGTMILASPVVNLNTLTLLLAVLAPIAWQDASPEGSTSGAA
jgi:hypothetical protein